jgi:hypothetical protein
MRPGNRAAVQLAAALSPKQWEELEATGHLTLTIEQLGPRGPELVREYASHLTELHQILVGQIPPGVLPPPPPDPELAKKGPLVFAVRPHANGVPYGFLGVGVGTGPGSSAVTITGSHSFTGTGPRWIDSSGSWGDPVPPQPNVTIRFQEPPTDWGELLRRIAAEWRLPVVCEAYTPPWPPAISLQGPISGSLTEVLDQLCSAFGYEWRFRGGVYEFRGMTWYVSREQEPPATLVKAVKLARAQKQPLAVDWLAAASTSVGGSFQKLERLCVHAPGARPALMGFRDLLQFYASLTPSKRQALTQEEGLEADALSLQQREALAVALERRARDWPPEAAAQVRVRLFHVDGQARFTFAAGERSVEASIALPSAAATDAGGRGSLRGFGASGPGVGP